MERGDDQRVCDLARANQVRNAAQWHTLLLELLVGVRLRISALPEIASQKRKAAIALQGRVGVHVPQLDQLTGVVTRFFAQLTPGGQKR